MRDVNAAPTPNGGEEMGGMRGDGWLNEKWRGRVGCALTNGKNANEIYAETTQA